MSLNPVRMRLIVCALVLLPPVLYADPLLRLSDTQEVYPLGRYISVLEDASGKLTINDITRPGFRGKYRTFDEDEPGLGYSRSAFWIRLQLKNESGQSHWLLDQRFANAYYLDLYVAGQGGETWEVTRSGNLRSYLSRDIPHRRIIFKLPLSPGQERTVYLRFENQAAIKLNFWLWSEPAFANYDRVESFWIGVFYGLLAVFLIINLLLFLFFRKTRYLYLVLFIASIGGLFLFNDGYAQMFFGKNVAAASRHFLPMLLSLAMIAFLYYGRAILSTTTQSKYVQRLHYILVIAWSITFFMELVAGPLITMIINIPLILITTLFLFLMGVLGWRKQNTSARFIVLGMLSTFLGGAIQIAVQFGFVESHSVLDGGGRITLIILLLFMSLAMVEHIQWLQLSREKASKALSDIDQKFRFIFDQTYDMTGVLSPDGILLEVNKTALTFGSLAESDVLGKKYWETAWFTHNPVLQGKLRAAVKRAATGEIVRFEMDLPGPDGTQHWIDFSMKPSRDDGGRITMLIPEGRDITERKRNEQAINDIAAGVSAQIGETFFQQLVLQLAKVFDADHVFIGLVDENNMETVNTLVVCAHGKIADNISYPLANTPCANVIKQETCAYPNNVQDLFPDDQLLVEMNAQSYIGTPLYNSKGAAIGLIVALNGKPLEHIEQVTEILQIFAARAAAELERSQAQHQLELHRDHLEELVQERTARLEAVNEEMESFSHSVSHDLRAPLRAIDGFSLAVLEDYADKLDAEGRNKLQRVRHGAQRMSSLIDDMLQLSRITRHEIRREKVDLSRLAATVLSRLEESEPDRKVDQVIAREISVHGDSNLLELVLDNLLGNAWKYTGKTANPNIEFGVTQQDGETVYFVKDNGVGFNMKYADKLFGAFQRLHKEEEFPGSGIGLATVQRILHRHGGRIWAEAEEGKGATFYFTLPKA